MSWVLLATRPRAAIVQRLTGTVASLMLAAAYSVLAALFVGRGPGDFSSLAGVSALFANPWLLYRAVRLSRPARAALPS